VHDYDVLTVLLHRPTPMAGPNPYQLSPVKAVYYEVVIAHLGARVHRFETHAEDGIHTRLETTAFSIGWATYPYPPYCAVGEDPFSLALSSKGSAVVTRGEKTRRFKLARVRCAHKRLPP